MTNTTHITDEAVQAAQKAVSLRCKKTYLTKDQMYAALSAALPHLSAPCAVNVDAIAQEIRRVNGKNDLGAGALAELLMPFLSCAVAKPVDVAAVRRQEFGEGFENGVEQSLNALDAYDDITRNEAEQAIRTLKPDYRALSAEPAQGNHIADVGKMVEAMKETRIDLVVLSGNIADAAKSSDKWEGMYDRVRSWIDRIDAALPAAPTTEAEA